VVKKLRDGIHLALFESLTVGTPLEGEDVLKWRRYRMMKEMGWTYQEYQNTPISVTDQIWAFIHTEAKAREKD
jgi:hypothetical protein